MLKILVPVDGSKHSGRTIDHVLRDMQWLKETPEIHLLNVQHHMPYGQRVSSVIGHDKVAEYHREEGMAALKPEMAKLDSAGVKYHYHIGVGDPAEVIVQYARDKACDEILMGTHGLTAMGSVIMGSVATKVVALTNVPVVLVK